VRRVGWMQAHGKKAGHNALIEETAEQLPFSLRPLLGWLSHMFGREAELRRRAGRRRVGEGVGGSGSTWRLCCERSRCHSIRSSTLVYCVCDDLQGVITCAGSV
jgi:hypothetical protein